MSTEQDIYAFLSSYDEQVASRALKLRELLLECLPGITEQVDLPAKMIAYCYGQKYSELICVIIPSKKGLKLGFTRGAALPDPHHLLEGTGKVSRYIQVGSDEQIGSAGVRQLLQSALAAYEEAVK